MRIGFFTDTYFPMSYYGLEISMDTFRKNLEAMGHQVFIYAPESPGYKDENPNVFRFKSRRLIKDPEMRYAFIFLPAGHTFKEIAHFKLDVVHAHTPFGLGILAKYISERQLAPLIYTYHTHYTEYAKTYLKEKFLLPYLAKVYSTWFANISDAVIAPSLKMKKLLLSYGVEKKKPMYILPTGINLGVFKKSPEGGRQLRSKLGIPGGKKILLSVSRMAEEKNVQFVIRASAQILKKRKDALLLLVGGGHCLEQLKKVVEELEIAQSVIFTGKVPYEEIPAYYQAADVFLFASLTDSQGIVLLEALACGLPVVVLKDDAFFNIVFDGRNGFALKGQSPELFARKALEILDDPEKSREFSREALKTAQKFSKEHMAEKLLEIYQTQINKRYQLKR